MITLPFADRRQAGHLLGRHLADLDWGPREKTIVLGLARGGVAVAAAAAEELGLPLDVVVVRKLGVPRNPELAMGAVAGGRIQVLDEELDGGSRNIIHASRANRCQSHPRGRLARTLLPRRAQSLRISTIRPSFLSTMASPPAPLCSPLFTTSMAFTQPRVIAAAPVGTEEACSRLKIVTAACLCLVRPKSSLPSASGTSISVRFRTKRFGKFSIGTIMASGRSRREGRCVLSVISPKRERNRRHRAVTSVQGGQLKM